MLPLQGERKWTVATEQGLLRAGRQDKPLLYGPMYSSASWTHSLRRPRSSNVHALTHTHEPVVVYVPVSEHVVLHTGTILIWLAEFKKQPPFTKRSEVSLQLQ